MGKEDLETRRLRLLSQPVEPVDVQHVNGLGDLLSSFSKSSIQARNLGRAYQVWLEMLKDPERPAIVLGIAGPLIAAGLRRVLSDAVREGLVDVVVSTGAILYQDLYQSQGHRHFVGSCSVDDGELRDLRIDRIYDTFVDERAFEETDRRIAAALDDLSPRSYSSRELLDFLAQRFSAPGSLLGECLARGVPVFCPALTDSSIGIALTLHYSRHPDPPRASLDPVKDNYEFTQLVAQTSRTGVVFVGGGTPKNWINDAVVSVDYITGKEVLGHRYAVQVTTDAPQWGGLSGSTLHEAMSWGKVAQRAAVASVAMEASVALPLLVGALLDHRSLWKDRHPPRIRFDGREVAID